MIIKRFCLALALIAPVAACVGPQAAPPPPPPAPVPAPAPPPAAAPPPANWMDAPATAGGWHYGRAASHTEAAFLSPSGERHFAIRCDSQNRSIVLSRTGSASSAAPIRILTETQNRIFDGQPAATEPPSLTVSLQARDPLLDAMAFSKGRFAVESAGRATLYLPSWAEVSRVIEDCR